MPLTPAQRSSYADDHRSKIPYFSSPRHLAGPGDPRHVTHALLANGWTITSAPGDPRTVLTGPDHNRHRLVLDPLADSYWHIEAADWAWNATFSPMVLAEIVAGLTDRLTDGAPRGDAGLWARIEKAGWSVEHSPDGTVQAHSSHDYKLKAALAAVYKDGRTIWKFESRPKYDGPSHWRIWISGLVPPYLLDGLAEQLVADAPVIRGMFDPEGHGAQQVPSGLSPEGAVEAHFARVDAFTKRTRAHRRARPTSTPPAPAVPTFAASASPR